MKKLLLLTSLLTFSSFTLADINALYIGKIKSIYSHERETKPYFGIELEGEMNNNPCGDSLSYFIKKPEYVSELHLSLLLAAHMAGKTVEIRNQTTSGADKCHSSYPTFNYVKIL